MVFALIISCILFEYHIWLMCCIAGHRECHKDDGIRYVYVELSTTSTGQSLATQCFGSKSTSSGTAVDNISFLPVASSSVKFTDKAKELPTGSVFIINCDRCNCGAMRQIDGRHDLP